MTTTNQFSLNLDRNSLLDIKPHRFPFIPTKTSRFEPVSIPTIAPGEGNFAKKAGCDTYIVKAGDCLGKIAIRYGISPNKLKKINGLKNDNIRVKIRLAVPSRKKEISKEQNKEILAEIKEQEGRLKTLNIENISALVTYQKNRGFLANTPLYNENFIDPVPNPIITSGFGIRRHPFTRKRQFHSGIDIGMATGTKIQAVNTGKVIYAGWYGNYGRLIMIYHVNEQGESYISKYAHCEKLSVKEGAIVNKGDVIALSGNSGRSTAGHLHFEINNGRSLIAMNPLETIKYLNGNLLLAKDAKTKINKAYDEQRKNALKIEDTPISEDEYVMGGGDEE